MSQNLLKYQLLSNAALQTLSNEASLQNGEKMAYGIAWKIGRDSLQGKYVYHGGSSIGGRSFLLVFPQQE